MPAGSGPGGTQRPAGSQATAGSERPVAEGRQPDHLLVAVGLQLAELKAEGVNGLVSDGYQLLCLGQRRQQRAQGIHGLLVRLLDSVVRRLRGLQCLLALFFLWSSLRNRLLQLGDTGEDLGLKGV